LNRPSRLLFGLGAQGGNGATASATGQNIQPDIIETYLGGASASGDWTTWNLPKGYFVQIVAQDADSVGAVPMYTLYQMAQNGDGNLSGLNSQAFMTIYWANVKILFQQLGTYGKPALVNFEPDFWGYAETAANDQPANLFAYVNTNPDCASAPNNVAGIVQCLITMARKYAPQAYVGFPPSDWGTGATKVAAWMNAIGAQNADFIVGQTLDRDAGCYEASPQPSCNGTHGPWYLDETNRTHPNYDDEMAEMATFHAKIGNLPVIMWQTPMGVPSSTPGGTISHYRDNHVHYYLTNPQQLTAAGILGVVFGTGANDQTSINTDNGEFAQLFAAYLGTPAAL
jgi:hypothetical protein